ncbi:site-specific DNA-methyltransferase [Pseudidiomarina aquimaris]|nr:site-specific DNA-methyltransferase [Pseudidiomarina aquimaris]
MEEETLFTNQETANSKQLSTLKRHFPQCFDRDGKFIQERLSEMLGAEGVEVTKETYSLNWLGKSYARLLTNLPPQTMLRGDTAHNEQPQNKFSQNLLIKGDNLEVLKHMVNAYAEKVKMIYIDPPYNTGKDGFTYTDEKKFTSDQLSELAGIDTEEAKRIVEFTSKGSNSHSAWLTFMYPRLYIARELLRHDGVIFISIDENELNQLKVICDEIFGEANFVENIVWNKRIPKNDKGIGNIHEYILVYAKSHEVSKEFLMRKEGIDDVFEFVEKLKKSKTPIDKAEKSLKKFYKMNGYDRGITLYNGLSRDYRPWGKINMSWPNAETFGPKYEVLHPITNQPVKIPDRGWRWKRSTFEEAAMIVDGDYTDIQELHDGSVICGSIWFAQNERTQPSSIKFLDEVEEFLLRSIISTKSDGGVEVEKIFGAKGYFSYPKPTSLIRTLLGSIEAKDGDIFLDFFAGSGTTAHAVLLLNAEDGVERKYVCIQLPEKTDKKKQAYKDGYKTIFEITKARIIRSSEQLKVQYPAYAGDLGFKIFETTNDFRIKDDVTPNLSNLSFFDDVVLSDDEFKTLLTTWCLYDGNFLNERVSDVDLAGYIANLCGGILYLITPGFTRNSLKELLQKLDFDKSFAPTKIVVFGNNFESARLMEVNEALKSYANKKSLELELVVRN